MKKYTVKELAELAGVSVRTLHYYDEIGLLRPGIRSASNYRYYGQDELLRLQQILLYRELDIPLSQIAEILDDPDFDLLSALKHHKLELRKRRERMTELLNTVDKTIEQIKNNIKAGQGPLHQKKEKMDNKELYKGFTKGQAEAWTKEAEERWGKKTIADSHKKILAMDRSEWEGLKQKADDIYTALVNLMHEKPAHPQVQALVDEHYEMTCKHFDCSIEIYRNLGSMYVDDERFTAFYDKYRIGLAAFLRNAIHLYCDKRAKTTAS